MLKDAIDFAIASEIKNPRNLKLNHYRTFGREPFGDAIGPIKDRGEPTGVVVHKGVLVAEWGEPQRVDMTHSVTKSFLSSVVGLAYDGGMIRSVDDIADEPHGAGGRGADRRGPCERSAERITQRNGYREPAVGDAHRHGGAAHPQAA